MAQKNNKIQKRVKKTAKSTNKSVFVSILVALGVELLVALCMLAIGAKLCMMFEDPSDFVMPVSLVCVAISVFAGSFAGMRLYKDSWLLFGVLLAISILGLSFVMSLTPLYKGGADMLLKSFVFVFVLIFSLIGAKSASQKNTTRRKTRSS